MDEAGSRSAAQLTARPAANYLAFQLRAFPLRTLTLGVLIVSGGVLAALPFRRSNCVPDASDGAFQVTGPTPSTLGEHRLELLAEMSPDAAIGSDPIADLTPWSTPADSRRCSASIPLSYDDLVVPIDRPATVQRRFGATSEAQRGLTGGPSSTSGGNRSDPPALVMPPLDVLDPTQQDALAFSETVIETETTRLDSAASSGQVASFTSTSARVVSEGAATAVTDSPQRRRHWIRQPD